MRRNLFRKVRDALWPSPSHQDPLKQYLDWVNEVTNDLPFPLLALARAGMWIALLAATIVKGLFLFAVFAVVWVDLMEWLIKFNPGSTLFVTEFYVTAVVALIIAYWLQARVLDALFPKRKEGQDASPL